MNPANFSLCQEEIKKSNAHSLHKQLHLPGANKQIYSGSMVEQLPSAWYGMNWGELTASSYDPTYTTRDDRLPQRVAYKLPQQDISSVEMVSLIVNLPPMQVAEKYKETIRIAWPDDIGIGVIEEALPDAGGAKGNRLNRHSMKMLLTARDQYTEDVAFDIGKRPELNNWSTELPGASVGFIQPFFFNDLECGLVAYTDRPISFEYAFLLNVLKLLKFTAMEDGEWKRVRPDRKYLQDMVEKLPQPVLIGRFLYNSKFAMAMMRDETRIDLKFTDIVQISAPNATNCRQAMEVTFEREKNYPVKCVFAVVENVTKRQFGDWCAYSPDILEVCIRYAGETRMIDRTESMHSRIINQAHFGRVLPRWLRALPYTRNPFANMETDVYLKALDASVDITMHQREEDNDLYRYHVFLVVQRIMTYENASSNNKRKADEEGPKRNITLKVTMTP